MDIGIEAKLKDYIDNFYEEKDYLNKYFQNKLEK